MKSSDETNALTFKQSIEVEKNTWSGHRVRIRFISFNRPLHHRKATRIFDSPTQTQEKNKNEEKIEKKKMNSWSKSQCLSFVTNIRSSDQAIFVITQKRIKGKRIPFLVSLLLHFLRRRRFQCRLLRTCARYTFECALLYREMWMKRKIQNIKKNTRRVAEFTVEQ